MNPPVLLTIEETSALLRISKKTIYRWVFERRIPHIKLQGKLLFSQDELIQYVQASKRKSIFPLNHQFDMNPQQSSERSNSRKGSLI